MLKRMRSFLVLVMLFIAVTMSAQVTTATMSGKVTAQDEPIIGATVVAVHEPSGTRYGTVTNVSGQFNLQGMRTGGPYKVEISYVGYQTAIYKGINLLLGENYVLNVSLKESSELLDEVVVTASKESNMKSDRAGAIMNANRDMINSTPTISRSISDIMRLSPQGADVGNGFAVGGGNYRQSFVTVDGAAFNNTFGLGGNLPANGSPISLDALEQVTVAVTPFDVRQSGFTGGAINAVTRSGDNQFRGTAYMYFNNENLKGSKVDDYELLRSKAQYYTYLMNGLMTQLVRIEPGNTVEEAHMRNRQLIARWVFEKGAADKVVELVKKDGKTYVVINDYQKVRQLFGELLAEIQRIKSTGDFEGARTLVENYAVKVDPALHAEVLERYKKLNLAPYKGFVNPKYELVTDENGNVTDVTVSYDEGYVEQMLRYSTDYSPLPSINN